MAFTIQPAVGDDFFDREVELEDILNTLQKPNSTTGFALIGKRKMGKTSIFKEVQRRLLKGKNNKLVPVYFSVWDLVEGSVAEFARELSIEIIEAYKSHISLLHRIRDLFSLPINFVKNTFSQLKISAEIQDSLTFILSFERDRTLDHIALIDEVFTLPEKLAKQTTRKSVLLIDEFPDIVELKLNGKQVGDTLLKKIRTICENYKMTSLNISGSVKKTMEIAVLSSASAFYRQFVIKEIGPFSRDTVREIILKNTNGKIVTNDALNLLYEFTHGIPFYVQFIGRLLDKRHVKAITEKVVEIAINEFLSQEGDIIFKEEYQKLSDKERLIVLNMATKDLSRLSEIQKITKNSVVNLAQYLIYLEEKEVIQKEGRGVYSFVDPIFKIWLRRKYPL